jgi:hypothetical protein
MILAALSLPPTLVWTDAHAWSPVSQASKRTLDGTMITFHRALKAGRPITLEGGQTWGWLTGAQVESIAALAASPGAIYPLQINGQTYQVAFRHDDAPAFEARPLRQQNPNPGADTWYVARIKLITVE